MRSRVVLPQPEGPEQGEELAGLDAEADVVDGDEIAEAARDVGNFEKRHDVADVVASQTAGDCTAMPSAARRAAAAGQS